MSNDTARILQELEIITGTLIPDADMPKLKIRYEEIVANYSVERKTPTSLENDLAECEYEENYSSYLFSTESRPYRGLANASIQNIIHNISERSGLSKNVHPHILRHTFATLAMDNGIELGDLQQLMGHESSSTTLEYATVSESRKHTAHKRFVQ